MAPKKQLSGQKWHHNLWYNIRMIGKIPSSFKSYFWDVDFSSLDLKNSGFIIKRVLDRGNTGSIKWLVNNFSRNDIKDTIMNSRDLSQKTANFWSDVYNLDKTKILCLQKPYSLIPWSIAS